jgi:streptomycin 6-kinase
MTKTFKKNIITLYKDKGKAWLQDLPTIITDLQKFWGLKDIKPVEAMNYSFVAKALDEKLNPLVIKISCDESMIEDELRALNHFDGQGAIRLIDFHKKHQALLLEQAIPGQSLKTNFLQAPDETMRHYIKVSRTLHNRPLPPNAASFPSIESWFLSLDKAKSGKIPDHLLTKAHRLKTDQIKSIQTKVVLHGDLHLGNILNHKKGWIAIDPKGLLGDPAFEISAFDLIDETELQNPEAVSTLLENRIEKLSNLALLDPQRVRKWIFLRMVLSAAWFIEDKGDPSRMVFLADCLAKNGKL